MSKQDVAVFQEQCAHCGAYAGYGWKHCETCRDMGMEP